MNKRMTLPGRARLSDVARLAGVSASTVSRVLSHPGIVADATRDAVLQAVEASGYRMNHAARNLRKQRTGCVVALVPNLGNPFFAKILDGMGRELARNGYDLLVADTLEGEGRHRALERFLDPSRADGIILLDGLVPHLDLGGDDNMPPVITACEWIEGAEFPRVMLDNHEGGRLAVEHLCSLGHRRIGVIGGPPDNVLHKARLAGAQEGAATGQGEGAPVELMEFEGDFTLPSGNLAARAWAEMQPEHRPTAVFAFSDEMACAFMSSLQRMRFSVPQDVSIIGFDDIELVSHLTPALTTIHQPKREIGRKAAGIVLDRIAGREIAPVTSLKPLLMVRETTQKLLTGR